MTEREYTNWLQSQTHPLIQDMPTPAWARIAPPRALTADEVQESVEWAHTNYTVGQPINRYWHPVIVAECVRMNEAQP